MAGEFDDLHDELRTVAGDLLAKHTGVVSWRLLADAGWMGLEAPEDAGGAGATFAEVTVVLDEMGRAATTSAFLGAAVLSVGLLASSETTPPLLGAIVAGDTLAATCLSGDQSVSLPESFTAVRHESGGWRVRGRATFVLDAVGAQRLLVPIRLGDGSAAVVDVGADAAGVTVTAQPVLDETRAFGTVVVDDVVVPESSVWRLRGDGDVALRRLLNRAQVAVACDSMGISEAMLAATVDYVGVRHQFGRAIGSFQAVKHACADMYVQVAVARQLVDEAVHAAATDAEDASTTIAKAKAYTSDTAVAVAGKAMQLHGGIGYTWESGLHVYLKRATLNRSLFGSPAALRARLANTYG